MALIRRTLRAGTVAGLAMIPFGALFRIFGLRINEYGRKTLTLLVGEVRPPGGILLTLLQHLVISWIAAVPLLLLLDRMAHRRARVLVGMAYGAAFYTIVNSLALPFAFGDPTPWQLGLDAVYPSFTVHLVYGAVVARMAGPPPPA
jgi:membrane-associated protease RseP (regulator of RpoE activity)